MALAGLQCAHAGLGSPRDPLTFTDNQPLPNQNQDGPCWGSRMSVTRQPANPPTNQLRTNQPTNRRLPPITKGDAVFLVMERYAGDLAAMLPALQARGQLQHVSRGRSQTCNTL